MCNKKNKVQAEPEKVSAVAVAAPSGSPEAVNTAGGATEGQQRKKKASGKKALTINGNSGTGINM